MKDKEKRALERILKYCYRTDEHINRFGDSKEIYMTDKSYQDACGSAIIQIGENAKEFDDKFRQKYDKIPWSSYVGMRNIFAHNYEGVIDDITWSVIKEDIPKLREYLEDIKHKEGI